MVDKLLKILRQNSYLFCCDAVTCFTSDCLDWLHQFVFFSVDGLPLRFTFGGFLAHVYMYLTQSYPLMSGKQCDTLPQQWNLSEG